MTAPQMVKCAGGCWKTCDLTKLILDLKAAGLSGRASWRCDACIQKQHRAWGRVLGIPNLKGGKRHETL